jgi:hypothetical protein
MKEDLLLKELIHLLKQNSKSDYFNAIEILNDKKRNINEAKNVELDSNTRDKYYKILIKIEKADLSLRENRSKYYIEKQTNENDVENCISEIDKIWEQLYIEKIKYESWLPSHEYSYFNLTERMAILRVKNYSSIFNSQEMIAIEHLRGTFQELWLNRSFLCGELLIMGKNEYMNIERYVATELGYENREEIPFTNVEMEYYRVNKSGTPIKYDIKKNNIHFIHINFFQ